MNKQNCLPRILTSVVLVVGVTACTLPSRPVTQAAAAVSQPLSSGEILHVVHTLNNGEIRQAQLALQRSDNPLVEQTAQVIVRDHAASNQRILDVARSAGIQPQESPLSRGLQMQASEIRQDLAGLSGRQFDCAYLQKQVELHTIALQTVRNQLLPSAQDPQVRNLLQTATPALAQHRQIAQGHQAALQQCQAA